MTHATPYDLLSAAQAVAASARQVRVEPDAIARWAEVVEPALIQPAARPPELTFTGTPEQVGRCVLLMDALNFCFWTPPGETPWTIEYAGRSWSRYYAMVAALHRGVQRDSGWLDPRRWQSASRKDVEGLFAGEGRVPMLEDRVGIIRETGSVLLERWGGSVLALSAAAGNAGPELACVLADGFPSFRDVHEYHGMQIPILKRAQIFACDLAAAWAAVGGPAITALERITAFADYRIPQILRHLGILVLAPGLEDRIGREELISSGSEEEIELRAGTIWSVELMTRALRQFRGVDIPAWRLDEYLWERSHDPQVRVRHHRTFTHFY